jgi:preprotein translocase subunit SecA
MDGWMDGWMEIEREILDPENIPQTSTTSSQVVNALTAKELYVRERQYLVREAQVVVVDEFTGRPVEGRNWSDGLQQAIEAKEGGNQLAETAIENGH